MRKIFFPILIAGFLALGTQAMAETVDVTWTDHGTYFHGPFAGTQMWVNDRVMFRNHSMFDSQAWLKFDVTNDLAGRSADDIVSATLSFSTMHVNENLPAGFWPSPSGDLNNVPVGGLPLDLFVSAYADAPDMTLTTEPGTINDPDFYVLVEDHRPVSLPQGETRVGTYLETISFDVTSFVKGWVNGDHENHGFRLDIFGVPADVKTFMWTYLREEIVDLEERQHWVGYQSHGVAFEQGRPATLSVNVVPVPAAVWLLGAGVLGLIGLRHKRR